MFGYLSDDHTWVSVELRDSISVNQMLKKAASEKHFLKVPSFNDREVETSIVNGGDAALDEDLDTPARKLNEEYLNVWSHLDEVEAYFKPV